MNLIEMLDDQREKVDAFQRRQQRAALERTAQLAANRVDEVLGSWQRLLALDALPGALGHSNRQLAQEAASQLRLALGQWDAAIERETSTNDIETVRDALDDAERAIRMASRELGETARQSCAHIATQVKDANYLAAMLRIDTKTLMPIWQGVVRQIESVIQFVEGKREQNIDGWEESMEQFDREASAQACLRLVALPPTVDSLVQQLLAGEQLSLAETDREALLSLLDSPALARVCKLTLPREGNS